MGEGGFKNLEECANIFYGPLGEYKVSDSITYKNTKS